MIRNVTATGIGAGGANPNNVSLENVHSINNGFGVAAATGNRVSIKRSVFSGNTLAGVEADAGGQVGLDNSLITGNAAGLQNSGTMSFANTSISFNNQGISGTTTSFGNNRIFGNVIPGTAPSVGAATTDHSQQ